MLNYLAYLWAFIKIIGKDSIAKIQMPEKVYESKSPILFELIKPIKTDDLWSIH